jgi:hypothetical protein
MHTTATDAATTTSNKFYYALAKFNQLRQRAIFPSASARSELVWVVRGGAAAPLVGLFRIHRAADSQKAVHN